MLDVMRARWIYVFEIERMMSDFYEEEGNESGKERGGDKAKDEEQPAVEPVEVVVEGVVEERNVTIIGIIQPPSQNPIFLLKHHES